MSDWKLDLPKPKPEAEKPPFNPADLPLGTTAEKDGVTWYVVWDHQDHRHYWNDKNKDI